MTPTCPRCPRCGKPPALRRKGGEGSVSYGCRCGHRYEIELEELAVDTREGSGQEVGA